MAIFNFYIVLSSVTATTYYASFKADSDLQSARPALAFFLCFFSFIFWKLDGRNKALIKNAEAALRHFEQSESGDPITKVFTNELVQTDKMRNSTKGWRRVYLWRWHLGYSDCFNSVFAIFFLVGLSGLFGLLRAAFRHVCAAF